MKVILVPAPDKVPDPEKEAETLGMNIPVSKFIFNANFLLDFGKKQ